MPYGKPFTEEERKLSHLSKYGTLENFPEKRKGEGTFWKEKIPLVKREFPFKIDKHEVLMGIYFSIEPEKWRGLTKLEQDKLLDILKEGIKDIEQKLKEVL